MEEGWREFLQVVEHAGTQGVQDTLAHLGHEYKLDVVCPKVEDSYTREDATNYMQTGNISGFNSPDDAYHHQPRDQHVAEGVHQDGNDGNDGITFVRPDVSH